jgi:hypothetical protein
MFQVAFPVFPTEYTYPMLFCLLMGADPALKYFLIFMWHTG